jgi:hypothetical protein
LTRAQDQPSGMSSEGDIPKVRSGKKIKELRRFETSVTVSSAHCVNSPDNANFHQHSAVRLTKGKILNTLLEALFSPPFPGRLS